MKKLLIFLIPLFSTCSVRQDNPIQHEFVDAASKGELTEMARLLTAGASLEEIPTFNDRTAQRYPALFEAIHAGNETSVIWLLGKGTDPNRLHSVEIPDIYQTPLDFVGSLSNSSVSSASMKKIKEIIVAAGGLTYDQIKTNGQ